MATMLSARRVTTNERQQWALDVAQNLLTRVQARGMRHALFLWRHNGKTEIRRWHHRHIESVESLVGVYDTRATIIDVADDLLEAVATLPVRGHKGATLVRTLPA